MSLFVWLFRCLFFSVLRCSFLALFYFFFSVECALHLSLVVRISSRGALQKEKVAIADLHLLLSFFFFFFFVCLFVCSFKVGKVLGHES